MRKKIVAGNWKMNLNLQEGLSLAKEVNQQVEKDPGDVTVIVAPPFIHLAEVARNLTSVKLSAQNCASETSGAYTGEVSAEMILSTAAEYVIIGHSERRSYYGEDDELLSKKVKIALENNLKPIFCCGEHLEEREAGNHFKVVETQLSVGIFNLSKELFSELVIAYEPVWAIGTGVTASADQAQEMHAYIRGLVKAKYGDGVADNTSILYGGSCKPSNARELFENPDVDGGLIGGASLNADEFLSICRSF